MMWIVAICIALAIIASLVLVPIVRATALAIGIVDHPDSERKLHSKPVALGGGLAVYLALIAAFVATILIDRQFFDRSLGDVSNNWYILFLAAGAMLLVGLVDDAWSLRGRQKLLLQCLIAMVLVGNGTVINEVSIGFVFELGVFAYPLTVLWLLMAVNALNLIDGADGMATTAGSIICLGLGFLCLHTGMLLPAVVGFGLAGTLAGFLVFNRPPASIYLGDAGSMMIGLFVGVLAVWSNAKETTVLASAPIAILAIPLFDSTAAIMRRWLTGRSIYATDRAHLHHLLQEKYGSNKMLLVVATLCATTTAMSVLSIKLGPSWSWLAGFGVLLALGLLVLTRSFGHAEARLLMGRAAHFAQSFASSPGQYDSQTHHSQVPLQGVAKWETIWDPLVEFAKAHDLAQVKIDLNLSWLQEGYHANWQSVRLPEKELQLNISVPLFSRRLSDQSQVKIGRLELIARAGDPGVYQRIANLSDHLSDRLSDLGPEIDRTVLELELDRLQPSQQDIESVESYESVSVQSEPVTALRFEPMTVCNVQTA